MKSIKKFFEEDHKRLDKIFENFEKKINNDFNKAKSIFHDFKIGLQRHIVWEENVLFPIFEEKTGMKNVGPTQVMRIEHKMIKEQLEKIHDKIKSSNKNISELSTKLIEILSTHNKKEESILYPWIDETLDKKELSSVFEKLKNIPEEDYSKCCE